MDTPILANINRLRPFSNRHPFNLLHALWKLKTWPGAPVRSRRPRRPLLRCQGRRDELSVDQPTVAPGSMGDSGRGLNGNSEEISDEAGVPVNGGRRDPGVGGKRSRQVLGVCGVDIVL